MKPIGEMTFEEWVQYKKNNHKDGAVEFGAVKKAFTAIKRLCFNNGLQDIKFWWMPPTWEAKAPDLLGAFVEENKAIYVRRSYFIEHSFDDNFLSCMFHELVHAYCSEKGIKDVDGKKHLQAFANACEVHGGWCLYVNDEYGYNMARLTPDSLRGVRAIMKRG